LRRLEWQVATAVISLRPINTHVEGDLCFAEVVAEQEIYGSVHVVSGMASNVPDADFTDAAEGKPVVDINDDQIGVVTRVEDGTAYVEYAARVANRLRSSVGGDDPGETIYALREEMIDHVSEDFIRVRGDHRHDEDSTGAQPS
jgi:hypothetical protein